MSSPFARNAACASCRLRQAIAIQRSLRSKQGNSLNLNNGRSFHSSRAQNLRQRTTSPPERLQQRVRDSTLRSRQGASRLTIHDGARQSGRQVANMSAEDAARRARETFGDHLPDNLLNVEQSRAYERFYDRPTRLYDFEEEASIESGDVKAKEHRHRQSTHGTMTYSANEITETEESDLAQEARYEDDGMEILDDDQHSEQRAHPLTTANRFATFPSTIQLPKDSLVQPISDLTADISNAHIAQCAANTFGGPGLPNSTATPAFAKTRPQTPIPLDVSQGRMSEIQADTFCQVLMPPYYACLLSVLVETRKRLGTAWAEGLVKKAEAGTLRILDAGGAGMGVLAMRDLLKAEWERMIEEHTSAQDFSHAIAQPDGMLGGAHMTPPLGAATVLIASNHLRHRSATLLENTTFVPRLPDYIHTVDAKNAGKFDIILAPHNIWPIRESWERRAHIHNLWSLLNADGGVLCLLEKGVARGFEAIADARKLLLNTRIKSSDSQLNDSEIIDGEETSSNKNPRKEAGMIIAPCTNHTDCPMYLEHSQGTIKGRKDICHFEQRYIKPAFLNKTNRHRNHEDVKFSYLSVIRGRDLRSIEQTDQDFATEPVAVQGETATELAFAGYADSLEGDGKQDTRAAPSSLSLPRAVLPPLKRKGHVILDMCSPSGKLERWTVTRSFSKQAFRDARKSSWGDLWALGAKTRVIKSAQLGKHARKEEPQTKVLSKKQMKDKRHAKERKMGKQGQTLLIE